MVTRLFVLTIHTHLYKASPNRKQNIKIEPNTKPTKIKASIILQEATKYTNYSYSFTVRKGAVHTPSFHALQQPPQPLKETVSL